MSTVGQKERQTQARVIKFFRERLDYDFLGNWIDREDNRNIEENSRRNWLAERGVSEALITRTLHQLGKAASLGEGLIVEQGEGALDKLPKGIRDNKEAMAETIENNLRKLIIDEQPVNPKYYEKMVGAAGCLDSGT